MTAPNKPDAEGSAAAHLANFSDRQKLVAKRLEDSMGAFQEAHPITWPRRAHLALAGLLYLEMLHDPAAAENLAALAKVLSEAARAHSRKTTRKSDGNRKTPPARASQDHSAAAELTDEQLARTIRDLYGLEYPPPASSASRTPAIDADAAATDTVPPSPSSADTAASPPAQNARMGSPAPKTHSTPQEAQRAFAISPAPNPSSIAPKGQRTVATGGAKRPHRVAQPVDLCPPKKKSSRPKGARGCSRDFFAFAPSLRAPVFHRPGFCGR